MKKSKKNEENKKRLAIALKRNIIRRKKRAQSKCSFSKVMRLKLRTNEGDC